MRSRLQLVVAVSMASEEVSSLTADNKGGVEVVTSAKEAVEAEGEATKKESGLEEEGE